MKHHAKGRPIGKCRGCCLNTQGLCAAGLDPKTEWARGRCRCLNDGSILDRYYHPVPLAGAKAARRARRAKAVQMNTVPHHDGHVFVPAREGG